jgi:hypothetical protein
LAGIKAAFNVELLKHWEADEAETSDKKRHASKAVAIFRAWWHDESTNMIEADTNTTRLLKCVRVGSVFVYEIL